MDSQEAALEFQTYGPFKVPMNVELKADDLARQYNQKKEHLNEASGVYIFADGKRPMYVGEAYKRSFGSRIPDHFNRQHNKGLKEWLDDPNAEVSLLLIALARAKGGDLRRAESNKGTHHYAIHMLERSLIGACLAVNHDLFNVSKAGFYRDTHVPGYLNSPKRKLSESAMALQGILEPT